MKLVLFCGVLHFIVCVALGGEAVSASRCGTGMASWYGKECSTTASGEIYDPSALTAAHRTLPFGTRLKITNLSTKCIAVVRINDRGPFQKNRVLDVSKAAAQQLKMIGSGTARVQFEVIRLAER